MNGRRDVLTREECLRHLAEGSVGRVSMSSRALPAVLPVRYSLAGERILFWADPHDHPEAIADNTVIGFQADEIDAVTHEGWSVMVVGRALARQAARGRSPPWKAARPAVGQPPSGPLIALSVDLVNGRRSRARAFRRRCHERRARDVELVELARDECLVASAVVQRRPRRHRVPVRFRARGAGQLHRRRRGDRVPIRSWREARAASTSSPPASRSTSSIRSITPGWSVLVQRHRVTERATPKSSISTSSRGLAARSHIGCAWCRCDHRTSPRRSTASRST